MSQINLFSFKPLLPGKQSVLKNYFHLRLGLVAHILGMWRQEDQEFKAFLKNRTPCLKKREILAGLWLARGILVRGLGPQK